MPDDVLPAIVPRPSQPATIPMAPNDLHDRTPLIDELFTEGHLYQLRSTIAAHTSRFTQDPQLIGIAVLVSSELVINAIRHGGGHGRVRLWHLGTDLYIQVADQGPGLADRAAGTIRPTPGQAHQRGLWIVRELAHDVHIDSGPGGTTVTVRVPV